ncbi:hypothetical protein BJ684DRAFT_18442 [Piptocephalis cylindrospora]|uniref:Autophagy-related protein 16 domain-containing protein n=1 Tax=Piptocephalis cylindrospora TaxID=1907219 RepID=A0A4P9Y828_9FUNG|nr:hypothetical protein BJ684DRAFT_18442 [Piptocephalis cylindrospora]|eukprot:RKP15223.1 hypothetical protein BJ684DRAFT_18442 [Piptocephalis cylindrospora]
MAEPVVRSESSSSSSSGGPARSRPRPMSLASPPWYTLVVDRLDDRDRREHAFSNVFHQVTQSQMSLAKAQISLETAKHQLAAHQTEALRAAAHEGESGDWGHFDSVIDLRTQVAQLEERHVQNRAQLTRANARLHTVHTELSLALRQRDEAEAHRNTMLQDWNQHQEKLEALQHLVQEKDKIILMLRDELQTCQLELVLKEG